VCERREREKMTSNATSMAVAITARGLRDYKESVQSTFFILFTFDSRAG